MVAGVSQEVVDLVAPVFKAAELVDRHIHERVILSVRIQIHNHQNDVVTRVASFLSKT